MLDKAIESGKEKRKQYKGTKLVAGSCRNNGGCPYREGNRTHKNRKRLLNSKQSETEI